MYALQRANGLQLDNNLILDEKIQPMLANLVVFIKEWNWFLPNELNTTKRELDGQRFLVNTFQKARPQFAMDANCCRDDPIRKITVP